jgi:hypothetical protein
MGEIHAELKTTIKEMLDRQAAQIMERERERQAQYVWKTVNVTYCHDEKAWVVTGIHNTEGNNDPENWDGEVLATARLKADAIEDAKLYAFDTSCGSPRAPMVSLYTKSGKLFDSLHAPIGVPRF